MLMAQGLACFVLWIAYGFWMRQRAASMAQRLSLASKSLRITLGSLGFFVSAGLLIGGLYGIQALGGIRGGSLTGWAWAAVAVLGLGFIHLQTLCALALVTNIRRDNVGPTQPSNSSAAPKS